MNAASTETTPHTDSRAKQPPRGSLLRGVAMFTSLAVLIVVFHAPLLRHVYSYLVVNQPVSRSSFAVIGDGDSKIWVAASNLYRAGMVRGILVLNNVDRPTIRAGIQPSLLDVVRPALKRHGVPYADVHSIQIKANTLVENIKDIDQWLGARGKSAIYVAPAHRSRYCRNAIDLVLGEKSESFTVHAVQTAQYDTQCWWKSRSGVTAVFSSYLCLFSIWNGDMSQAKSQEWDPDEYVDALVDQAQS